MAAADDIRDFLVADLASFLATLPQVGAPYVYSGQRFDWQYHGNNQHVVVKWIESPDEKRSQKSKRHEYQLLVSVPGQDKPKENTKSADARSYVESIIDRYDGAPSRFRTNPPNVTCYRSRCFQNDSIEIEESDRLTRRVVGLSLEVDVME